MKGFTFKHLSSFETMRSTVSMLSLSKMESGTQISSATDSAFDDVNKFDVEEFYAMKYENAPVVLSWSDVCVTVPLADQGVKMLINHVNGAITGGLWAIMGPSGSGKVYILLYCCYIYLHI